MKDTLAKYSDFFKLLSAALHPERKASLLPWMPLSAQDWQFIYDTASRHSVQGVMFDVVETLPAGSGLPASLAARWLDDTRKIEEAGRRISSVVEAQKKAWEAHGIDAVLIKGPESAKYYPVPLHRKGGDIDWWMRTDDDWRKALEVLRNNNIGWTVDSDGDVGYELGGVMVEHHRSGLPADGPEGELMMLAGHIFHHVSVSGVGLRQVCDFALALEWFEGRYDRGAYLGLARRMGLKRWTLLLESMVSVLDGKHLEGHREKALLELVMEDGNFGFERKRRFSRFAGRALVAGVAAPGMFVRRWAGLVVGRMKRNL